MTTNGMAGDLFIQYDGKGRYLLREGDKVELADILTLTFKT
jgi:hypothetical protein